MMSGTIINTNGLKDISHLLLENGRLKLFNAEYYKQFKWEEVRYFCHQYARYGLPTVELVDYLKKVIGNRSAIEIGAGAGDLGFHLGVPMVDNKQQEFPSLIAYYKALNQPLIQYPQDVEKIDALEAVKKYKPQVVIGSWITPYAATEQRWRSNPYGIREPEILNLVETFIIIGNLDTHGDRPIRQKKHETLHFDWLVGRGRNQKNNCIFVWNKKGI